MRSSFAAPIVCCLLSALPQEPIIHGVPSAAEQEEMTARFHARAAEFVKRIPELACTQSEAKISDAVQGSSRISNVVIVDLGSHQLQASNPVGATVDVADLIHSLFSSRWQLKFAHLATLRGQRVEKYSSIHAAGDPYAEVYVNSDGIARIVFHGFDTPGHFATYHCSESAELVRH